MRGNVDLATAGALLHDVGKVESFVASAAGFGYTQAGRLLGPAVVGSIMLDRRLRGLPPGTLTDAQEFELHHFIQSHAGPSHRGAAVRPMTLEAELLQWADQSSANGNTFSGAIEDRELFPADEEFSVRDSWALDRRVWRRTHTWD
jgi:3'-5' exoribonuclease